MIKNYLKVALRYLKNKTTYSAINLIGLTLGFLCFLILNAYVSSEKSFDNWHGNTYRLLQKEEGIQRQSREIASHGPRIGYASKDQFPEIDDVAEVIVLGRVTVGNNPAQRYYERITAVDEGFFKVFHFKFLEGSPENLFSQANGILLTQSLKEKYFGLSDCLGETLKNNIFEGVVAGVVEDFPPNTHMDGDLIFPSQTASAAFSWWDEFVNSSWHRNSFLTYFSLKEGTDIVSLGNKITRLAEENWPEEVPFQSQFFLQDVRDIHLYRTEVEGEINKSRGNVFYVNIFFWIALIILLVACFNYTGLLNVAFKERSKEIGVRKVMGADRKQLLGQFFTESVLLTSIAMLLAWTILNFIRPILPQLFGPFIDAGTIPDSRLLLIAVAGLLTSLLSIAYPVYIISKSAIVQALKDNSAGKSKLPFRKAMAVFQFIAAITLIACTFVLYRQVNFLQQKELGFDMKGLMVVDINSGILRGKFEAIKQEFSTLPEVESVTVSSRVPGEWKQFPIVEALREGQDASQTREMIFIGVDQDFVQTYDLDLISGKNFSGNPSDSTKVLINLSAADALGLDDPIGQMIEIPRVNWSGDINPLDQPLKAQIEGVIADFHFEDFRKSIQPMVLGYWNNPIHNIDYYTLQVSTQDWGNTISALNRINASFDPNNPLEYNILDDRFQRFYEGDISRSKLLLFFSSVVIFIACLGLFAMTAFTLKSRTKEIGIRKVLGANSLQIVGLVTADFLKLVAIGALVAIPISFVLMRQWLNEFAYRVPLEWWLFFAAGLSALFIALLTVSSQSLRAATANPVDSLRSE